MGVNTIITLPFRARVSDVAEVIGVLAGLKPERYEINGEDCYVRVPGAVVTPSTMPECANIDITAVGKAFVDGSYNHHVLYHHEGADGRTIMPTSTPFWIAVGLRLVEFFGGTIQYQDNTDQIDAISDEQPGIHSEDGQEYADFQTRKLNVKPLTKKDIKAAAIHAAYK